MKTVEEIIDFIEDRINSERLKIERDERSYYDPEDFISELEEIARYAYGK